MQQPRPLDRYRKLVAVLRFSCRMIGVDVIDKNYKFNAITGFVVAACSIYCIFVVCTILEFFSSDWTVVLDVFSPVSCTTQGLVKLFSALRYHKIYYELYEDIQQIYDTYQQKNRTYELKLFEWNVKFKNIILTIGVIYCAITVLMLGVPVVLYLYKGELHMVLLSRVPGFEMDTGIGYIVTNAFNTLCLLIAAFGLYAGDLYLIMFLTYAIFFLDIFEIKKQELHRLVAKGNKNEMKRIPALVNDLVSWHKFYLHFTKRCNLIFYWPITIHICCTTFGILTTLLLILTKDWPNAYAYLVVLFVWLYLYSVLGTRVEICNDEFCEGIYDINWYDLPVPQQKIVLAMLRKSQYPRNIYIAGVVPLTMATALKITRTIYSLLMMVLQFWE